MGSIDRLMRFTVGAALLLMALFCPWAASFGPLMIWGSGIVGAFLLVTATVGLCPVYRLLGLGRGVKT